MQLLHWICVYCGCVSILNCKTSQSEIYLTAKTVGEAEEDTGALSFKTRRMDSPRAGACLCFYFIFIFFSLLWECESRTTGTADGTFGSIPTWYRLLSCEDARRATEELRWRHVRLCGGGREGGGEALECHTLLKGYWSSTYCSISCSAMPDIENHWKHPIL